ncbi:hypothetical protein SeLEV6574_g07353 [Synchytrium endobioticum]|uniref:Uncharacterized protein n=1 Tax=Synchytrium endobioticum TaxID=286115 RepID=A0A507CL69_9FUNG|nr:hypothetical protein SeLEV6574_g07353 [Synchytrium endobioticum]
MPSRLGCGVGLVFSGLLKSRKNRRRNDDTTSTTDAHLTRRLAPSSSDGGDATTTSQSQNTIKSHSPTKKQGTAVIPALFHRVRSSFNQRNASTAHNSCVSLPLSDTESSLCTSTCSSESEDAAGVRSSIKLGRIMGSQKQPLKSSLKSSSNSGPKNTKRRPTWSDLPDVIHKKATSAFDSQTDDQSVDSSGTDSATSSPTSNGSSVDRTHQDISYTCSDIAATSGHFPFKRHAHMRETPTSACYSHYIPDPSQLHHPRLRREQMTSSRHRRRIT